MKKIVTFIAILLSVCVSKAQTTDDIGKIALGINMPSHIAGLNDELTAKIETKIERICTANGIVAGRYANCFAIQPKVEIIESEVAENGIQNIFVVKGELTLLLSQFDGTIISTTSKSFKGSGKTKEKALNNGIAGIDVNDKSLQDFLVEGKKKMLAYYESRCSDIIAKAEHYAKREDYETAIALLMAVPEDVSCNNEITELTTNIYKRYQDKVCSQLSSAADAAIALRDYYTAAEYLTQISPNSSCYNSAQNTFKKLEQKVAAQDKREWDFKMKRFDSSVSLEKERIKAIREIAVSYFQNQPDFIFQQFIR